MNPTASLAEQSAAPATVAISLVSHTNAGKTTLARTLLQRDVGEVRDAPHVTEFSEDHLLLRSAAGDELRLWDTPGFGDSARLVKRLRAQGNPLGWFMSAVWDRWRDRPFWASQQALKHVRERSDAVLYLVNAAESPEAAGYVAPEMELLGWVGKPVIVLLNQLGAPRSAAEEAVDVERWRRHLAPYTLVQQVLPMDAFARCWVQELTLLGAVESLLPAAQRAPMARLRQQWVQQQAQRFDAALQSLAQSLGRTAAARQEVLGAGGFGGGLGTGLGASLTAGLSAGLGAVGATFKRLGAAIGPLLGNDPAKTAPDDAASQAQAALLDALDQEVRSSTETLIRLHGLEGRATGEILARVATQFDLRGRINESRAALVGGMLSGALAGLKADIATGGLTLGGGLLAGGLIGALGGAGLARGINVMRGGGPAWVGWRAEALAPLLESALLRYLAVAHFGRGRGEWAEGEAPAHWPDVVRAALAPQGAALAALWASRSREFANPGEAERLATALQPLLAQAARAALQALYPDNAAALQTVALGATPSEGAAPSPVNAAPTFQPATRPLP